MAIVAVRAKARVAGAPRSAQGSRPAIHGTQTASIQFPDPSPLARQRFLRCCTGWDCPPDKASKAATAPQDCCTWEQEAKHDEAHPLDRRGAAYQFHCRFPADLVERQDLNHRESAHQRRDCCATSRALMLVEARGGVRPRPSGTWCHRAYRRDDCGPCCSVACA